MDSKPPVTRIELIDAIAKLYVISDVPDLLIINLNKSNEVKRKRPKK
jgi:hypothetical protein